MVKKTEKRTTKKVASKKMTDFEPEKMGFAIAALASVSLVLLAMIAMFS